MAQRVVPDVWAFFNKVRRTVKAPKKDKHKKVIVDDLGQPKLFEKTITDSQCKKCNRCMCRNAKTMVVHYHSCVRVATFCERGYYLNAFSSQKMRKRKAESVSGISSSNHNKKRRRITGTFTVSSVLNLRNHTCYI